MSGRIGKYNCKLTDVDIGYICGMIDGEGCISIGKSKTGYLFKCEIFNNNKESLKYIRDKVGFGSLYLITNTKRISKNYKDSYVLHFSTLQACCLLSTIKSNLIIKNKQANILLLAHDRVLNRLDITKQIEEMHMLNKRGR